MSTVVRIGGIRRPTKREILRWLASNFGENPTDLLVRYMDRFPVPDGLDGWVSLAGGPVYADNDWILSIGRRRAHTARLRLKITPEFGTSPHSNNNAPQDKKPLPQVKDIAQLNSTTRIIGVSDFTYFSADIVRFNGAFYDRVAIMQAFWNDVQLCTPVEFERTKPLQLNSIDGDRIALIAPERIR